MPTEPNITVVPEPFPGEIVIGLLTLSVLKLSAELPPVILKPPAPELAPKMPFAVFSDQIYKITLWT